VLAYGFGHLSCLKTNIFKHMKRSEAYTTTDNNLGIKFSCNMQPENDIVDVGTCHVNSRPKCFAIHDVSYTCTIEWRKSVYL
jgi:hypothetical protein